MGLGCVWSGVMRSRNLAALGEGQERSSVVTLTVVHTHGLVAWRGPGSLARKLVLQEAACPLSCPLSCPLFNKDSRALC